MDPIGASAVRTLSTDVANLSGRLAVLNGVMEQLVTLYEEVNPNAWQHEPITDGDGNQNGYITTMPGEETDKLRVLLAFIETMK